LSKVTAVTDTDATGVGAAASAAGAVSGSDF